jgi:hypothetical protein
MFIFLTKNSIPERIKSRYQKYYDNSILSTEKANNHIFENPFILKETKQIEQRKKEIILENYLKNIELKIID